MKFLFLFSPRRPNVRLLEAVFALLGLILAPVVWAHPLGNFSINQYFVVDGSAAHPAFHYLLDVAEIPSFTELDLLDSDFNSEISPEEVEAYLSARIPQLAEQLHLRIDGAEVPITPVRHKLLLLQGNAGMVVFNILIDLQASEAAWPESGAFDLALSSDNYPDEQGTRECAVITGGRFRDTTPSLAPDVLGDQHAVEQAVLSAPVYGNKQATFVLQLTPDPGAAPGPSVEEATGYRWTSTARLAAEAGEATLGEGIASALIDSGFRGAAPDGDQPLVQVADGAGEGTVETGPGQTPNTISNQLLDRMSAIMRADELPPVLLALGLALAVALGMGHALSPGHGKTVMAAYLIGEQGTSWHAILLGIVVTLTHTWSVILLGLVTLYFKDWFSERQVNFWTGILSGAIIVCIGLVLFRRRYHVFLASETGPAGAWRFEHGHDHVPAEQKLANGRDGKPPTYGSILWLGISGGIVPCPAALIVLLLALKVGRLPYGLALILAFSVGLALVLVVIGLLVVRASRLLQRRALSDHPLIRVLPLVSAGLITLLGGWVVIWTLIQFDALRFT